VTIQKKYALNNLAEAKEAIEELMRSIETDPEYSDDNLLVDMMHIYWHVNRAWNGRNFDIESRELSDEENDAFIQFPSDLPL